MSILDEIRENTIAGRQKETVETINTAIEENYDPQEIIQKSLIEAMSIVGKRFQESEIYVPEMLIAARAMKGGLEALKPLMVGSEKVVLATVVIGTVKGDLHDIGKNLVTIMLEGAGCEVIDLGVDISPDAFVEAIDNHKPQFVGLSALLTTTMGMMKTTVEAIKKSGCGDTVKVMVGGAPVSQSFADEIHADIYADNAAEAVEKLKQAIP